MSIGILVLAGAAIAAILFFGSKSDEEEVVQNRPKKPIRRKTTEPEKPESDQPKPRADGKNKQDPAGKDPETTPDRTEKEKPSDGELAGKVKEEPVKSPEKEPEQKEPEKIQVVINGKTYDTYKEFVPGAIQLLTEGKYPPDGVDPGVREKARKLLLASRVDELLDKAYLYFNAVLELSLIDDETVARNAFEFFNRWCVLYKALDPDTRKVMQIPKALINNPEHRGAFYLMFLTFRDQFTEHFARHEKYGDPYAVVQEFEPGQWPWDKIIRGLNSYSIAADPRKGKWEYVEGSEGYPWFIKMKKLPPEHQKKVYPYLIRYIADEDPTRQRAATVCLNLLTQLWKPFPKGREDAVRLQKEWMRDLGIEELPR